MQKSNILFVVTSATNMGDLALCQEWIEELGRDIYQFGYVLVPGLEKFIDPQEERFLFSKEINIKSSILNAVQEFKAEALIFATNAFWNLPDYQGVKFGEFILKENDLSIPIFSFDPFEIGFTHVMPQNGAKIEFSEVPSWVYALRYMSRSPKTENARHFKTSKTYTNRQLKNKDIITKYGGDPAKKSIIFPISTDRYTFIKNHYPDYYNYLASLFDELENNVQLFSLLPEKVEAFEANRNIIQLSHIPFSDFQDLVQSAAIYLTDSYVSCIVTSFQLETPALLLSNSNTQVENHSFLGDKPFKYKVFPYGMFEVCNELESLFEVKDCFAKCEILDREGFKKYTSLLLEESDHRQQLKKASKKWKEERKALPSPREILSEVLEHVKI
ncbi:MAG: hypothetical protein ACI8ZM_004292 [Crocinitomix sp.]|jgi:hypothetical protein